MRVFAVVFLAYVAGGMLSWAAFGSTVGPAFFAPAGITAAALLLSERRSWPAIAAAAFLAELAVDLFFGSTAPEAVVYAFANTAEPVVGAALVHFWCSGTPDLRRRRDLFAFIAGSCVAGPLVGGLVGGGDVALLHDVWFPTAVVHWFAGDAIGVFVTAVPILLWRNQFRVIRSRPWETLAVLVVAAVVSAGAFWEALPPSMLVLPALAWAALRLDMLGAALAGIVVAMVANVMTASGRGLFANLEISANTRLALAQVFIAVNVLAGLLIAQEASGRIKAVREREVERRERIRLETLSRLAQQLAGALTPHDIGTALEQQVINDAGAKTLNLGLISADGATLQWVSMTGHTVAVVAEFGSGIAITERTVGTDAVRTGQPTVVPTAADYARSYPGKAQWQRISGTETVVGWPLAAGGDPFGVLVLGWSDPQPLDPAQLAYISAVATMVGQALVRARIYEDEHARAAILQSAVLPDSPGNIPGLEVCVTYEPADVADGVGGDWYDVMSLPRDRTYFAVGDVVGHGLPAVEDMVQLRAAGRTLAHVGMPPAQLLTQLNALTRGSSRGKFATMAVAVFDPAAAALSYCLAGHPPLLLRRCTGEVVRLSAGRGVVMGPLADGAYVEESVSIAPGDIVVMYTDGLVEGHASGIEAGIRRAQEIIADWEPDAELSRCCRDLQEELVMRPRADDVCVIVVRFGGDIGTTSTACC